MFNLSKSVGSFKNKMTKLFNIRKDKKIVILVLKLINSFDIFLIQ